MKLKKNSKSLSALLVVNFLLAHSASALTWSEVGDAGLEFATAQVTSGSGILDSIGGSLFDTGDLFGDVDLYKIFIDYTDVFSVTVSSDLSEDDDIALWLFDVDGISVFDDSGANEVFYVWDDIGGKPAGLYYLGIGVYGREPVEDDPLNGWEDEADPYQFGPYRMSLVGASFAEQVPSSGSTFGLFVFGIVSIAALRSRLKR